MYRIFSNRFNEKEIIKLCIRTSAPIKMQRTSKDDWVCSDPKVKCNRCGIARVYPPVRRTSDKSKGLFGPDDWICKSCGNVNWARRSTCNVCNTNKVNIHGERTGYGGGYMERDEVVEYRDRSDSDDEFDEFGRKKKRSKSHKHSDSSDSESAGVKKGNSSSKNVHYENSNKLNQSDGEEKSDHNRAGSDEEESGDEADLSKYDIWDNDEQSDKDSKPQNQRKRRLSENSSASGDDSEDSSSSSASSHSDSSSSSSSSAPSSKRANPPDTGRSQNHRPQSSCHPEKLDEVSCTNNGTEDTAA